MSDGCGQESRALAYTGRPGLAPQTGQQGSAPPWTARAPELRARWEKDGAVSILTSGRAEPTVPQGMHGGLGFSSEPHRLVQRACVMAGVAVLVHPLPPSSYTRLLGRQPWGWGNSWGPDTRRPERLSASGRGSCRVAGRGQEASL